MFLANWQLTQTLIRCVVTMATSDGSFTCHLPTQGVVIKYSEPPEARKPKVRWRLYPFKGEETLRELFE